MRAVVNGKADHSEIVTLRRVLYLSETVDSCIEFMPRETPFSAVVGRMLDAWILTSPERPARAEDVYQGVLDLLSIKMRLTLIEVRGSDPLDWYMRPIRHSGFTSRILNINGLFTDCRLGDFKDRAYMAQSVIPRLTEVVEAYEVEDEIPCGIPSCRTPHRKGFVVALSCADGSAGHGRVGHVCDERAFGPQCRARQCDT